MMPAWLIRGLTLALVHAVAVVVLSKIAAFRPADTTVVTAIVFALLLGIALTWGAIDGWMRWEARGMTWVIAALVAGPTAGVLNVIGRAILVDQTGTAELTVQLTSGAAFTTLLVLVPAAIGLFVGGRMAPSGGSSVSGSAVEPEPRTVRPAGSTAPRLAARRADGKRHGPAPRRGTADAGGDQPKVGPTG